ncbi:MAG: hypothetical protein AAB799_01220 [Patescibacteria group bacterium]
MITKTIYLLSVLIFIFLILITPSGFIDSESGNTILTITTFLFGLLAGFYIVVTTTDYNNLKSILANETATWDSLYKNMLVYNKELAVKLSDHIDLYIQSNFDHELMNAVKGTTEEFKKIEGIFENMVLVPDMGSVHQVILGNLDNLRSLRHQQIALGRKTVSFFQWVVLIILSILVIFSLLGLRTGALFFDVTTVLISSSLVLILLLIRDIDLYTWNEKFGFEIFEILLKNIGKLPYYNSAIIGKGRFQPTESEYRLGVYTNFPKSLERKTEIVKK